MKNEVVVEEEESVIMIDVEADDTCDQLSAVLKTKAASCRKQQPFFLLARCNGCKLQARLHFAQRKMIIYLIMIFI
jgi:hypothetical protein